MSKRKKEAYKNYCNVICLRNKKPPRRVVEWQRVNDGKLRIVLSNYCFFEGKLLFSLIRVVDIILYSLQRLPSGEIIILNEISVGRLYTHIFR